MNLKERIKNDIKEAMRAKENGKRDTLRNIQTAIKQIEVDERRELDEGEVEKILLKYAKQREDAIVQFRDGGRLDLVAKEEEELEIIAEYMPKQLSDEELKTALLEVIASVGAESMKDIGKVMGVAKTAIGTKADGGRINALAKALLG